MKIKSKIIEILIRYENKHPVTSVFMSGLCVLLITGVIYCGFRINDYRITSGKLEVQFEDEIFQNAVEKALKRDSILKSDLENISVLEIRDTERLENIEDIAKFKNLQELTISNCNVRDISTIGKLSKLTKLNLFNNKIYDIKPLEALHLLQEVELSYNKIEDITPLFGLEDITSLKVNYNNISELAADISNLKKLRILSVSGNRIGGLQNLYDLPVLLELYANNNKLKDDIQIAGFLKVEILGLGDNMLTNISCANELTSLNELYLSRNSIEQLGFLENCSNLKKMDISYNSVTSLPGIMNCGVLESLDMRGTLIQDVSELAQLDKFNSIFVDDIFEHSKLQFMVGNFKECDTITRKYLLSKQYNLD